jgi:hypothetical protein
MRWGVLSLVAAISISASAAAGGATIATDATQEAQEQDKAPITVTGVKDRKKRVICRGTVATGSLFNKRTCKTGAQWDDQEAKSKETHARLQEQQRARMATQQSVCLERPERCR